MKVIDKTDPTLWSEYTIHHDRISYVHKEDSTFLEDYCKRIKGKNDSGLGRLTAKIPLTIYVDLQKKGITKDPEQFRRWLNDRDNRVFRTSEGKV